MTRSADDAAGLAIAVQLREDIAKAKAQREAERLEAYEIKRRCLAAVAAHLNGREVEAARAYVAAYDGTPNSWLALFGAGLLAYQHNDLVRALRLLVLTTERAPHYAPGWYNAGLCWQLLGNPEEAERAHRHALKLDPELVEAYNQLGLACLDQGRHGEAIRHFDASIAKRGKGSEARFNRAVSLIMTGHFADGWREYEARHEVMFLPKPLIPAHVPKWDGGPRDGKHLLIWCEQGLGDSLMMARWLPRLAEDGPVTVIVPRALVRLFQASFPMVAVKTNGDALDVPFHVHASFMSLPWLTQAAKYTLPAPPYFVTEGA